MCGASVNANFIFAPDAYSKYIVSARYRNSPSSGQSMYYGSVEFTPDEIESGVTKSINGSTPTVEAVYPNGRNDPDDPRFKFQSSDSRMLYISQVIGIK